MTGTNGNRTQQQRISKTSLIIVVSIGGVVLLACIVVGIMMANPKPQPCQAISEQGWLYDADKKGSVVLYKAAAGVQIEAVVDTYGIGQSLIVDADQKCTYGEHVYYHVDFGDGTAGWVPALYLEWSKPRP